MSLILAFGLWIVMFVFRPFNFWLMLSFSTTLLYTGVHLPTWNPVLILAALTCGLFWGGLYWATGTLVPVLISHMIWDPLIFVIWPIRP